MSGELFRQPDVQLGYLIFGTTMGQLLSIPLLIAGIVLIMLWAPAGRLPPRRPLSDETRLGRRIARRIRARGAALGRGLHGDGAARPARTAITRGATRSARAGDFITAPEISQIFGELIGLWCAELWQRSARPDPVILVELGPGRGALMRDLLRAAATVPEFRRALRLYLVEASPVLRAAQQQRLARCRPVWVRGSTSCPRGRCCWSPTNSWMRLPIRQLVRGGAHWAERMVTLDAGDGLVFADGPESPAASLLVPEALREAPRPARSSRSARRRRLGGGARRAAFRATPGAALFIDYGYFPSAPGPTLRAVRRHARLPCSAPGTADLSAHVDFAAFAEAARAAGAEVHGPVPQGRFLAALGAEAAARGAARTGHAGPAQALDSGVERLLDPGQMGTLFKVVAVASPGLPTPPGFELTVDERTPSVITSARARRRCRHSPRFFTRQGGVSEGLFALVELRLWLGRCAGEGRSQPRDRDGSARAACRAAGHSVARSTAPRSSPSSGRGGVKKPARRRHCDGGARHRARRVGGRLCAGAVL